MKKLFRLSVVALLVVSLSIFLASCAQVSYPEPVGFVNDFANVLSDEQEVSLNQELIVYEEKTGYEISVVTVNSLEGRPVKSYALGLASAWGVGKKELDNGVVLLHAPNEREYYLAVGDGITDNFSASVVDNDLLPHFKRGELAEGLIASTHGIMSALTPGYFEGSLAPAQTPQNNTDTSVSPQTESDNGLFGTVALSIFGLTALGILGLVIHNLTQGYTQNKKNLDQCHEKYASLTAQLPVAKKNLGDLESHNPSEVTRDLRSRINNLNLSRLKKNLDNTTSAFFRRWIFQGRDNQAISNLNDSLDSALGVLNEVSSLSARLTQARKLYARLLTTIPDTLAKLEPVLSHEDVLPETKDQLPPIQVKINDLQQSVASKTDNQVNWLNTSNSLSNLAHELEALYVQGKKEIKLAQTARERGPKMLESLPDKIAELEAKIGSHKGSAKLKEAQEKLYEARSLSTNSQPNWLQIYLLLVVIDSLSDDAKRQYDDSVYTPSHSSHSTYDSGHHTPSDFGGFGDTGGFSGGGFDAGGGTGGSY